MFLFVGPNFATINVYRQVNRQEDQTHSAYRHVILQETKVDMAGSNSRVDAPHDETLNFRMVTHVTSSASEEVGDVANHRLSLSRFSGLAFFADESSQMLLSSPLATTSKAPVHSHSTPSSTLMTARLFS
jgi:hypothetical protein